MRVRRTIVTASMLFLVTFVWLNSAGAQQGSESVAQALCRLIDNSAQKHQLPTDFLTRLVWQESSFRAEAVSPVGAQGVAQFMPGTARERGLANPFDPEQAIPAAASLLADLKRQFGNLGLAAAAYNSGPARVTGFLAQGDLPFETRNYVLRITGRSVEDWRERDRNEAGPEGPPPPCLTVVAALRISPLRSFEELAPLAPWGVQLAGNFSKDRALASFRRAAQSYASFLPDLRPMIVGTRFRSRGTRAFYRVRVPAPSRAAAEQLCSKIRGAGGSCIVLPS